MSDAIYLFGIGGYMGKHISFRIKLAVCLLLAVMSILLFGQLMYYHLAAEKMRQQEQEHVSSSLEQMKTYLDTKMKNIIERLFYIRMNPDFSENIQRLLLEPEQVDNGRLFNDITTTISLYKITEPLLSSLYFYTPVRSYTDNIVIVNRDFDFEKSVFYERFQNESGPLIWGTLRKDDIFISKKSVIPMIYKFSIEGYSDEVALLANLDQNGIREYLQQIIFTEDATVILFDDDGNRIASWVCDSHMDFVEHQLEPEMLRSLGAQNQSRYTVNDDQDEYWLSYSQLNTAPWHLIYVRSKADVYSKLNDFTKTFAGMTIIIVILTFLAVMVIIKRLTNPLYQLAAVMQKAGEKKYKIDFPYKKKDEIGVLASSFDHMVTYSRELFEKLNHTISQLKEEKEKVRIEQLLKRRAELKALQAQINPHFLYNTLDSIRWKAEEIEAADISQMTQALATVFRIGLSRGQELISIEDEIRHVESYLAIQCQRYGAQFGYFIDVEPALKACYIVKLVLQPLVENAIYHGIRKKEEPGMIWITSKWTAIGILFSVQDDGGGIEPTKLKVLQENLVRNLSISKEGYGIFNVNERLKLYFGDDCGLTIDSEEGKGTVIQFLLPIIQERDVETYVPYSDSRR